MPFPVSDDELPQTVAPWLTSARWFGGKGLADLQARVHEFVAIDDGPIALALLDVLPAGASPNGSCEPLRYAVPLEAAGGPSTSPPTVRDAADAPAFADWLVRTTLAGRTVPGRRGMFHGHAIGNAPELTAGPPTVTPIGSDASNTSLLVRWADRAVVVKLVRRCRAGIQPEVEIGRRLAGQSGWRASPRLLGWLEHVETPAAGGPAASTALATVHECVPEGESAWDRLVSLLGEAVGGDRVAARDEAVRLAAAIGRATAGLHATLVGIGEDPDFAPRPTTPASRRAAATRMADHARGVFAAAASRLTGLPPPIADRLRKLLDSGPRLVERLLAFAAVQSSAAEVRVHGDYHLGQVLVSGGSTSGAAGDGVFIIDFEGEPARPLEERRAPASVCKDLAGMCRSFDYLLRHVGAATRAADLAALEGAFLGAYASASAGRPWWPADPGEAARLLDVHKLDKAVYELAYELANRPDWIAVPLAALEELAG